MAYAQHIVRIVDGARAPISLDDWLDAVEAVEGVRTSDATEIAAVEPGSGEVVATDLGGGTVQVFFARERTWRPIFTYRDGAIAFPAADADSPAWRAASALAKRLDARIVGDDGETYDLQTGAAS